MQPEQLLQSQRLVAQCFGRRPQMFSRREKIHLDPLDSLKRSLNRMVMDKVSDDDAH